MKNNKIFKGLTIAALSMATSQALAIDYTYSLYSTLRLSDNLEQRDNGSSGQALNSGVNFELETDANTDWQVELSGTLGREEFFDVENLEAQDTKRLSSEIEYRSPAANLSLLIRDEFSQVPRNRLATADVNNISDVNVFLIRPTYFYQLNPIEQIAFDVSLTDTKTNSDPLPEVPDGEEPDFGDDILQLFDSVTKQGTVRYERRLNQTNTVSLNFDKTEVEFEAPDGVEDIPITDYEQENVFLRWVGRGQFNQIQVDFGKARITDEFNNEFDTNIGYILFNRQINRAHEVEASFRTGFFVNFSNNDIDETVDLDEQAGSFGAAQEFIQKTINYQINDDSLVSEISINDSEFESTDGSRYERQRAINLTLSYSLQHLFNTSFPSGISITYGKSKNKFTIGGAFGERKVDTISAQYNFSYTSEVSFFIQAALRDSGIDLETVDSPTSRSDVNAVSFGFTYQPQTQRRPQGQ